MITGENLDRRFWIGASDAFRVVAKNKDSKTWQDWWNVKKGEVESQGFFRTIYTITGDIYEKPIAQLFGPVNEDKTIYVPEHSVRVNLDADDGEKIIECKTYKADKGVLDERSQTFKHYWMQVQMQMYAWNYNFGFIPSAEIRVYYVTDDDYEAAKHGYALPLDWNRIDIKKIRYSKEWIEYELMPNLIPLGEELRKKREEYERQINR